MRIASLSMTKESRPRLLTEPEEIAASDEFKRLLKASGKTQREVADLIGDGVSEGSIWQWANRRLAIAVDRAEDVARVVGGNPRDISAAYRNLTDTISMFQVAEERKPWPQSQRVGIPLDTIRDAMIVVKAYVLDKDLPADAATDPLLIKTAIDVVAEASEPLDVTNVVAFKKRVAMRLSDEGNDGEGETAATG